MQGDDALRTETGGRGRQPAGGSGQGLGGGRPLLLLFHHARLEVYDEARHHRHYPGSTNPQITERGMKTMFRMCGRDDQQG